MKRPPGITPPPPPAEPAPTEPPPRGRGRARGAKATERPAAPRSPKSPREPASAQDAAETAPIERLGTRGRSVSATTPSAQDAAETAPIGRLGSRGRSAPAAPSVTPNAAETAPIGRLGKRGRGAAAPPSGSDAAETVPITRLGGAASAASATGTSLPHRDAPETSTPAAPDYSSGNARRELRKASRQRRRYERSEARRFTQRSRRRRQTWIVVGASLAGLVIVVLLAAYSPLLAVRTLAIEGTSRLDAASVTAALQPQMGKPLALVDYGAIQSELAGFPLIASYSVEARPPDTLAVRVVERRPVAQVQSATGFDLIDAAGVTVQQSAERIAGFPLIDLGGTQIGSRGFDAAAAVLASLPDAILSQVDRVSGSTPDSVTMVFGGAGQRVVWGSAEDSELKARILERLIATQDPNSAVEYDVSSPQSPVVR